MLISFSLPRYFIRIVFHLGILPSSYSEPYSNNKEKKIRNKKCFKHLIPQARWFEEITIKSKKSNRIYNAKLIYHRLYSHTYHS